MTIWMVDRLKIIPNAVSWQDLFKLNSIVQRFSISNSYLVRYQTLQTFSWRQLWRQVLLSQVKFLFDNSKQKQWKTRQHLIYLSIRGQLLTNLPTTIHFTTSICRESTSTNISTSIGSSLASRKRILIKRYLLFSTSNTRILVQ